MDFTRYLGLINPVLLDGDHCYGEQGDIENNSDDTIRYVSDIAELPLARIARDNGQFWESIDAARLGASTDLDTDLSAFLPEIFPARGLRSAFLGQADCTNYNRVVSVDRDLPIQMRYQRGGAVIIRSIGLLLNQAVIGQVVGLYVDSDPDPIKTITLEVPAMSRTQTSPAKSWRLPMDGRTYHLKTVLPDGVRVGDNNLSCCSNTPNVQTLLAGGYTGKANGWMVTLSGSCSYDPLFEQLMDDERFRKVIAAMLAYKTAYRLCVAPSSGSVERSTVLSEDDLKTAAATCEAEYQNRLGWIRQNARQFDAQTDNCCFSKAQPFGWSRSGLFR